MFARIASLFFLVGTVLGSGGSVLLERLSSAPRTPLAAGASGTKTPNEKSQVANASSGEKFHFREALLDAKASSVNEAGKATLRQLAAETAGKRQALVLFELTESGDNHPSKSRKFSAREQASPPKWPEWPEWPKWPEWKDPHSPIAFPALTPARAAAKKGRLKLTDRRTTRKGIPRTQRAHR